MSRTLGLVIAAVALLALVVWLPGVLSAPAVQRPSEVELPASGSDGLQTAAPAPLSATDVQQVVQETGATREAVETSPSDWVLSGRARNGIREPRPGARLKATLTIRGATEPSVTASLVADEEGLFQWALPTPEHAVTLRVAGDEEGVPSYHDERSLQLGAEAPDDLDVRFYPLDRTIEGVVSGPDGPLSGAEVNWSNGAVTTDADGHYEAAASSARGETYLYAKAAGHALKRAVVSTGNEAGGETLRVDFELIHSFVVTGTVVNESGSPLEGAEVRSFFTGRSSVTTGTDGRYVLDHLDPGRESHTVYATKEGYVQATLRVPSDSAVDGSFELVLQVGARVEGLVRGPDGAPLAGARLYIGFSPNAFNRLDAVSDERGWFVFPNVGSGDQTLVTQYEGLAPDTRSLQVPEEVRSFPALEIDLAAGRAIEGIVRDDQGTALEDIWVSVRYQGEYTSGREVTDGEGHFGFEGLPTESLKFEFYSMRTVRHEVAVAADHQGILEVVVESIGGVAGRVVDAVSGQPLGEFTVRFVPPALEEGEERVGGYSATWAREGKRFQSPDGTWSSEGSQLEAGTVMGIEVRAAGYAPALDPHVVVASDPSPDALIIAMQRGGAVHGLLVDAGGVPVADAVIVARPENARSQYSEQVHELGIARTNAQGTFSIDMVAPGSTVLYITPPERRAFRDGPFEVRSGVDVERMLTIAEGGTLQGVALAPDGSPLVGRSIRLNQAWEPEESVPYFNATTTTDSEGSFRFEGLTDGTYQVSQMEAGDEGKVQEIVDWAEVADGAGSIVLQRKGTGVVRGRVEFEGAAPAKPVPVTAHWRSPPGQDPGDPSQRTPQFGALTVDGSFEITHLVPGQYQLSAFHQGVGWMAFGGAEVTVLDGQTVEANLTLTRVRR